MHSRVNLLSAKGLLHGAGFFSSFTEAILYVERPILQNHMYHIVVLKSYWANAYTFLTSCLSLGFSCGGGTHLAILFSVSPAL